MAVGYEGNTRTITHKAARPMPDLRPALYAVGSLFVLTFAFGYLVGRKPKPYNGLLFTVHKLIALGAGAGWARTMYELHRAAPLAPAAWIAAITTVVVFVMTVIAGGLTSLDRPMPAGLGVVHKVLPYVTALACAVSLFLAAGASGVA
jgi:hypothetical protein